MRVKQFVLQVNYVNSFVCYDPHTRHAFLVDCGAFEDALTEFLERRQLTLQFLLLTHSHYDHVDGLGDFRKRFNVPVYAADQKYGRVVREGETVPFAGREVQVLATPGHTPDGLSFYLPPFVFVGDAIFAGAVGGTSARAQFEEEIGHVWRKILTLPDETLILPGHGAPSTVGVERRFNPFFH